MKKPSNQLQETLYLLLEKEVTSLDLIKNGILSPTSKISQLRDKGVIILCNSIKHKNKFGRKIEYGVFSVPNKNHAKSIYNNLTN